jgi:hypothetical protein
MRAELLDFDWHGFGLSFRDFEYTLRLIKNIMQDRIDHLPKKVEGGVGYDENGNVVSGTEIEDEVIDDLAYYSWVDNFYVCHFGLWRLQGIFEGILKHEFGMPEYLPGLKKKLDAVLKQGYKIDESHYDEILLWAKIRNALTHNPPEAYKPHGLTIDDISEYCDLVSEVTQQLLDQKDQKNTNALP